MNTVFRLPIFAGLANARISRQHRWLATTVGAVIAIVLTMVAWPNQAQASNPNTLVSAASGQCLEIAQSRTDNGAPIIQWPCNGGRNQQWNVEVLASYHGGGIYRFRNVNSGKCIDLPGWSNNPGTILQQWDCHGGTNQQWKGNPFTTTTFTSRASGQCMDVPGGSGQAGMGIQQWYCNGNIAQKWRVG